MTSPLFSPFTLRGLALRNRIVLSPMLMYMAEEDGRVSDRHFVHYGARALGGTGLIMTEVVAVTPRGRISARDMGLWEDGQVDGLRRVASFLHDCGAALGVQLAHAGRKSQLEGASEAPSAVVFDEGYETPEAMSEAAIRALVQAYVEATHRAVEADVDLIQIHAAHGYLLHSFLCELTNQRQDAYGGSLEGRARLVLEIVEAVRGAWPEDRPLSVRMTALDPHAGGVTEADAEWLALRFRELGVDLLDVTTGNLVPQYTAPVFPGYQVPYAERLRRATGLSVATVGSLAAADLAEELIGNGRADLVCIGRELIRNPNWPIACARRAGVNLELPIPTYARATDAYERGF